MTIVPKSLISPRFGPEKLESPSTEDLIDVFEDRLQGWLLEPAEELIRHPLGQVPGFGMLLSYFEGVWIFVKGEDSHGRSKQFFREAFLHTFRQSHLDETLLGRIADVLYQDARCGFFHDSMFRQRIYFSHYFGGPLAITLPKVGGIIDQTGAIESIVVHPAEFFRFVEGHFKGYVGRLRDTSETDLRVRFEQACRLKWDFEGTPRVIAL